MIDFIMMTILMTKATATRIVFKIIMNLLVQLALIKFMIIYLHIIASFSLIVFNANQHVFIIIQQYSSMIFIITELFTLLQLLTVIKFSHVRKIMNIFTFKTLALFRFNFIMFLRCFLRTLISQISEIAVLSLRHLNFQCFF